MTKKYPDFSIIVFYVLSVFILLVMQVIILLIAPSILENDSALVTFNSISNLLWYTGLIVVFIYFYRSFFIDSINKFRENIIGTVAYVIVGMGIMFAAAIISGMILLSLVGDQVSQNQEAIEQLFNGSSFDRIAIIVSSVFFAPIVEELVFRKSMFQIFNKLPAPLIIFFSSLAFGSIHIIGDNPEQIIYYFALGLGLGFMYHYTNKNFAVVVLIHFIVNSLVTIAMFTS